MKTYLKKLVQMLRRPLPKKITIPVIAAAAGVLALVIVARQFTPARRVLAKVAATVGYTGNINLEAARKRWAAQLGPGLTLPLADASIVIRKGERALDLMTGGRLVKRYRIALGLTLNRHPDAAKERKGDGCTPEGHYTICTRNNRSQFHLFMGVS